MIKLIFRFLAFISVALIVSSCSQENAISPTGTTGPVAQQAAAAATVTMQGEVAQVTRSDGTPLVFARGADNKLYYSYCKSNAMSWYPFWTQICGSATISGNIVAIAKSNGEVWLFSKNSSNKVVYSKCPSGGSFSTWATLGGTTGLTTTATAEIAAGLNSNGTIEVFAKKTSVNTLFKLKQNTSGTWPTSWPTSAMASGTIGDRITVGMNNYYTSGRLQVFAKNSSNQLVTLYQTTAGGSWTTTYSNLSGTVTRNISVVSNHQNKLEVYVINNQTLQRRVQTGSSSWSAWENVSASSVMSTVTVIKPNFDGNLQAFYVGNGGMVSWMAQTTPGSWVNALVGGFGTMLFMPQNANIPAISANYHSAVSRWMLFAYGGTNDGNDLYFTNWDFNNWSIWANALLPFDLDGNIYKVVKIGNQIWLAENLKTTQLMHSGNIPEVTDNAAWAALQSMAYCWYGNDIANKDIYGALYNFYTVETGDFGIEGWHVPSEADRDILQNYLIANGYNWDGTTTGNKVAKSMCAQSLWLESPILGTPGNDLTKNNSSGFSALPGGHRDYNGIFYPLTNQSCWWTQGGDGGIALGYILSHIYEFLMPYQTVAREGYYVRLVRN